MTAQSLFIFLITMFPTVVTPELARTVETVRRARRAALDGRTLAQRDAEMLVTFKEALTTLKVPDFFLAGVTAENLTAGRYYQVLIDAEAYIDWQDMYVNEMRYVDITIARGKPVPASAISSLESKCQSMSEIMNRWLTEKV